MTTLEPQDFIKDGESESFEFKNSFNTETPVEIIGKMNLLKDGNPTNGAILLFDKLVVEAFFLTGDIEKYGTGFHRVRSAISRYPSMKFKYREIQNGFLTELSYEEASTDNTLDNTVDNTVDKTNED